MPIPVCRPMAVAAILVWLTSAVRAEDSDAARAVIEKAIRAHGGEKVGAFKAGTWKAKGNVYILGLANPYTVEWSLQLPDRMRVEMQLVAKDQKVAFINVVNGGKGWNRTGNVTAEMEKDALAAAQERIYVSRVAMLEPLRDKAYSLSALPETKIGGTPAVGVRVSHKGRRDIDLFFDKDSGLRIASRYKVTDDLSGDEADEENLYADYKEFDGVKHPMKLTIKRNGKTFLETQVTDFKPADKLDDMLFAEP